MMNARSATLLILVVAAALLATGCGGGGGGGGTTTLSKDEFASKITKICTEGRQKITDLKISLSSVSTIAKSGDKAVDLESEQIDKFKSLAAQAPDEIKAKVDDFVAKAETSRDKLRELVDAAKKGDAAKMASVAPEVTSTGQAVHDAANAFGATC
jgi:predicted small secreted protein